MTTEEKDLKSVLSQAGAIRNKYDQIAEITGEKFNVFSILGLQDKEVRLHSAFIGALLNPKGNHGQKDLFLKLFIKYINQVDFNSKIEKEQIENALEECIKAELNIVFDTKHSKIEIEKTVKKYGRIDLIISNNNEQCIIIENKIWATDQYEQLIRYKKHQEENYSNDSFIFYLAPYRKKPDKSSIKNSDRKLEENKDYYCLDYKDDILPWLEECKKEASSLPLIRETITQYINVINNYYGLSINHKEEMEIVQVLAANKNTFLSANQIYNNFEKSKDIIRKDFFEKLKSNLINEIEGLEIFTNKEGISHFRVSLDNNKEIYLWVQLTNGIEWGFKSLHETLRDDNERYNIIYQKLNEKNIEDEEKEQLSEQKINELLKFNKSEFWIGSKKLDGKPEIEFLADLYDESYKQNLIIKLRGEILEYYCIISDFLKSINWGLK